MELGESTEDTARREVLEETGLVIGERCRHDRTVNSNGKD